MLLIFQIVGKYMGHDEGSVGVEEKYFGVYFCIRCVP